MSSFQKVIKYGAITFAILLAVGIITAIASAALSIISIVTGNNFITHRRDLVTIDESKRFSDVSSLDIDIAYGNLTIRPGDSFHVEANDVLEEFEMKVNNKGTLIIRDRKKRIDFIWFKFNINTDIHSNITLYVPTDYQLEKTEIIAGAGKVDIDSINTKKLIIDAGAGSMECSNVSASEVNLNGGAGTMTFTNVYFKDMDLDCGVGKIEFDGVLLGENNIDCGIGNVELDIASPEEDYDLSIDSGIGRVRLNDKRISKEYRRNNNASSSIDIDGGIGYIDIRFGM